MNGVNSHLSLAQCNASDEVLSLKPCEVVLEKLPPVLVEEQLRHPEDEGGTDPGESDSDSGNSLFITQKPVPRPVRSRRTRHRLHLEEHSDDSLSHSSFNEPEGCTKKKRRKKHKLPVYSFPFLPEKCKHSHDIRLQNTSLHDAGTRGFLRLVKELCMGSKTREDVESLPAENIDEDSLSPLPEEEAEQSETEDIKVVERKLFAVQLKSKRQQTWCSYLQQKNTRNAANARQEPSQEKQFQAPDEEPATANTLMIEAEENELAVTQVNSQQQPETQETKRLPEGKGEEGDTPYSEQTTTNKSVGENATLEEQGNFCSYLDVDFSASSCVENGGKENKEKHKTAEDEEQLQSGTAPETRDDEENNWRKNREEIITEEEGREEGNSWATSQQTLETSFDKRKIHLSCADKCAGVSSLLALSEIEDKSAKKKKKRKKRKTEEGDNSPNPVENTNNEHFNNTQNICAEDQVPETAVKRKKKKRRERESCSKNNDFEQGSAQGDDSVSVQEERRTSSFLCADAGSLQFVEPPVTGSEQPSEAAPGLEHRSAENDRNVAESNNVVRKKKKKRKRESCVENKSEQGSAQCDDSVSVQERIRASSILSADAESLPCVEAPVAGAENDRNVAECNDEVRKKKKKRKRETCSENESEQGLAQGDDLVSVQEENRTLSILSVDLESLQYLEAPVRGAENDRIVKGHKDGIRKKQKKKKRGFCCENESEQGLGQGDDSVSVQERKRTLSMLSADGEPLQSMEVPVTSSDKPREAAPGLENRSAENDRNVAESDNLVRKKKRKRESCFENASEQGFAQDDDSVSLQERKRTSSFLNADAESLQSVEPPVAGAENNIEDAFGFEKESIEIDRNVEKSNDVITRKRKTFCENESEQVLERKPSADAPGFEKVSAENDKESNDGVRKKKKKKKDKKRKLLEMHDSVEKDQDLEEADTCRRALSEGDGPGVKRRKERKGNELMSPVESLEGAVNAGLPSNHETMVLKKKKKSKDKTCDVIQQSQTAPTEDIVSFNATSLARSVNLEQEDNNIETKEDWSKQTAEENMIPRSHSLSKSELLSSDRTKKNKHVKVKRRLYKPIEGFSSYF